MAVLGGNIHVLRVSISAVPYSVGIGVDVVPRIRLRMHYTGFIDIGVVGRAVALCFQIAVGVHSVLHQARHIDVDHILAVPIPEQLGVGALVIGARAAAGRRVHPGAEELGHRIGHVVIGDECLDLRLMVAEVVDLQIDLLVRVGVVAAVRIHGVGINGKAVIADGGEIGDGVALGGAVRPGVGGTGQKALAAKVPDHRIFVCRIAVHLRIVEVVEQPASGNRSAVRINLLLCIERHITHNAVVGIGVDVIGDLPVAERGSSALDVVDHRVAALHVAHNGGVGVIIAGNGAVGAGVVVVGDAGDLGIRHGHAVIVLRPDLLVFIQLHKGGVDLHAVEVIHHLIVRAEVGDGVIGGGDPCHQHLAVSGLGDRGLEVGGVIVGDGNGFAPLPVGAGCHLQRRALGRTLAVVAVDEGQHHSLAVSKCDELGIGVLIGAGHQDLLLVLAGCESAAHGLITEPHGIVSVAFSEQERAGLRRLAGGGIHGIGVNDILVGVIGIILKGSAGPAAHREHQRDGEQEQVDDASHLQVHVATPGAVGVAGLPVADQIDLAGEAGAQRSAQACAEADLSGDKAPYAAIELVDAVVDVGIAVHGLIIADLDLLVEVRTQIAHDGAVDLQSEIEGDKDHGHDEVPGHLEAQGDIDVAAHAAEDHGALGIAGLFNIRYDKVEVHAHGDIKAPRGAAQAGDGELLMVILGILGQVTDRIDAFLRRVDSLLEGLYRGADLENAAPVLASGALHFGDVGALDGIKDLDRREAEIDSVAVVDAHDAHVHKGEVQVHAGTAHQGQVAVGDLHGVVDANAGGHHARHRLHEGHACEDVGIGVIVVDLLVIRVAQVLGLCQTVGGQAQIQLVARLRQHAVRQVKVDDISLLVQEGVAVLIQLDVDAVAVVVQDGLAILVIQLGKLLGLHELNQTLELKSVVPEHAGVHRLKGAAVDVVAVINYQLHLQGVLGAGVLHGGSVGTGHGIGVVPGFDPDGHAGRFARHHRDIGVAVDRIGGIAHLARDLNAPEDRRIHRADAVGEVGRDVDDGVSGGVRNNMAAAAEVSGLLLGGEEGHIVDLDLAAAGHITIHGVDAHPVDIACPCCGGQILDRLIRLGNVDDVFMPLLILGKIELDVGVAVHLGIAARAGKKLHLLRAAQISCADLRPPEALRAVGAGIQRDIGIVSGGGEGVECVLAVLCARIGDLMFGGFAHTGVLGVVRAEVPHQRGAGKGFKGACAAVLVAVCLGTVLIREEGHVIDLDLAVLLQVALHGIQAHPVDAAGPAAVCLGDAEQIIVPLRILLQLEIHGSGACRADGVITHTGTQGQLLHAADVSGPEAHPLDLIHAVRRGIVNADPAGTNLIKTQIAHGEGVVIVAVVIPLAAVAGAEGDPFPHILVHGVVGAELPEHVGLTYRRTEVPGAELIGEEGHVVDLDLIAVAASGQRIQPQPFYIAAPACAADPPHILMPLVIRLNGDVDACAPDGFAHAAAACKELHGFRAAEVFGPDLHPPDILRAGDRRIHRDEGVRPRGGKGVVIVARFVLLALVADSPGPVLAHLVTHGLVGVEVPQQFGFRDVETECFCAWLIGEEGDVVDLDLITRIHTVVVGVPHGIQPTFFLC